MDDQTQAAENAAFEDEEAVGAEAADAAEAVEQGEPDSFDEDEAWVKAVEADELANLDEDDGAEPVADGMVRVKVLKSDQTQGVHLRVNGLHRHLPIGEEVVIFEHMLPALDDADNLEYEIVE